MSEPPQDPWARPADPPGPGAGSPANQPAPAAPPYGQPSYGQPPYGQPPTAPYGQPPYTQPPPRPYGAPPYGQPYGYAGQARPRDGLGTAALVVGIAGVVLSWTVIFGIVLGVLAIVFGIIGRGRANRGEASNKGQATAGVVLGGVAGVIAVAFIALFVWVWNTDSVQNYRDCLQDANGDQVQIDECGRLLEREFQN